MGKTSPSPSYMYGLNDPPFINLMKTWAESNREKIGQEFSSKLGLIETILNTDYAIASHYMAIVLNPNIGTLPPRSEVLISAYHRNWFAFTASYELTCKGLFGPARSILRHAFESMIIAKFCSISKNDVVYEKWLSGDTIYFTNSILKKISKPDTKIFSDFWSTLSDLTHATVYAQQISLDWEHVDKNVQFTLDLILVLLEWHYHILTSHIMTPSNSYYATYTVKLFGQEKFDNLSQLKKHLRLSFRDAKQNMPALMKQAVRDFKQTWVLCE